MLILLRIKVSTLFLIDLKEITENGKRNIVVVHRWTRWTGQRINYKRWIRLERKEPYWWCNNETAVYSALFWESFVCIFIGACDSGDAWIPYIHNQESWITKISANACHDVFQGVKKVLYKKKFNSSSCCWASTFYSHSDVGVVLIFTTGKVELRWCFFSFVKVITPPILRIVFHCQKLRKIYHCL